ncbi:MAG: choice-of-anchor Q domain-containing protein, partial [Acidimicrobiales bacterium]
MRLSIAAALLMGGALVAGVGLLKKVDEKRVAITHQQRGLIRHFAWFRRILLLGGGLLLATTALVVGAQVASANTSVTLYVSTAGTVTTGCTASGTGACETIQEGVAAAEALSSSDVTVEVAAGTYDEYDTIAVPSGDTLTLQGAGASTTTVNGGSNGSVFTVSSGTATIDGFTITDGLVTYGAGVNNAGTATLTDDTFSGDTADFGGGVYNAAAATATLTDDTFSGDSAEEGGGVYNDSGTATLTDDTFSEDSVSYAGGGVSNDGTATLTDDTFSGDSTPSSYGYGGGVYNDGTASLTDDTLSGDSADFGGGVYNDSGTATISNSILDGAPCGGTIKDGGFNVESDDTCGFVTNDLVSNTNINLASSLVANGSSGPETLAITSDSSAFEEVPAADCTVSTDERGDPRPGIPGANCDAGAFEYQAQTQTITMAATGSPTFDQSGSYNVDASSNDSGATLAYTIDSSGNTAGCTVAPSSGVVSFTGLGGCTIDVNSAAQGTYAAAPQAQQVLTVAAGVQATLVVNSTSATYPYSLVLTTTGGSGGGAVTYVVNTGGTASGCTNTSGTLTATSAGTCFVTATKAADADYASASSVQTTVTFSLATQATLVVNSTSATYPYSLVLTTTGGSGGGAVTYVVNTGGTASG